MKVEAGYPHVEGEYGIKLDDIPFNVVSLIVGGSGKELRVLCNRQNLIVRDAINPGYRMDATVRDDGQLSLYLVTRVHKDKHPDFFAGHFVTAALEHFKQNGVVISHFRARWLEDSDNYLEFVNNRSSLSMSSIDAARNTWTGRLMCGLGFSDVDSPRLFFHNDSIPYVEIIFSKPGE